MAPAMTSPFRRALCALLIALGSASIALAESTFFEVASTPYDHQMQRIQPFLNTPAAYTVYAPSLDAVNGWIWSLRTMPYQYSHQWRTPSEVQMDGAGDCKGKALALYGWMRSRGATNVRFVIGRRRAEDALTHAWLEWDTQIGTYLLDPTFNWTATPKTQDWQTYVAYYGYRDGHKYRAGRSSLASRTHATRSPAAPARGTVARTLPSTHRSYYNSWPVYEQPPIQNVSQVGPVSSVSRSAKATIRQTATPTRYLTYSNSSAAYPQRLIENVSQSRTFSNASRPTQSQMHNLRGSVQTQRKPISHPVRYDQLARPAFVQARPIAKQSWAEPQLFIQH